MPGLSAHWIQNVNKGVSDTAAPDGGRIQDRSTLYDSCKYILKEYFCILYNHR